MLSFLVNAGPGTGSLVFQGPKKALVELLGLPLETRGAHLVQDMDDPRLGGKRVSESSETVVA